MIICKWSRAPCPIQGAENSHTRIFINAIVDVDWNPSWEAQAQGR